MGIIGVVAALTIPTIIQNSNNRKFASQFKKTMSGLSQAAIMSQAQYDSDYSSLNTASDSCDSESLAKSNLTMCGLLNSTLSGHTFLGLYGTAKGANANSVYQVSTKALPALDENFMIFALADGAIVGFNKNATRCGVTPGTPMSATVLGEGGALANCVGFIDVNGPNSPNKEVTCKNADDTVLNPSATCAPASAIGDVFPIVFHDGIVEPASNAARAILSAGKGNPAAGEDTASSSGGSTPEPEPTAEPEPQYINGHKLGKRDDPSTWEAFKITTPMTKTQCNAEKASLGIISCRGDNNDYWAAAVKECGGVQNMLTDNDLKALAETLYDSCNSDWDQRCSGRNSTPVPSSLSGLGTDYEYLWLGNENDAGFSFIRVFNSSSSYKTYDYRNDADPRVVCVEPKTN